MADSIAYQGETLKFTFRGSNEIDLINNDFIVIIYLHCNCNDDVEKVEIPKKDCTKIYNDNNEQLNMFEAKIPYTTTKDLATGMYNAELLFKVKNGDGTKEDRSVYMKKHAFRLEWSASKTIE